MGIEAGLKTIAMKPRYFISYGFRGVTIEVSSNAHWLSWVR